MWVDGIVSFLILEFLQGETGYEVFFNYFFTLICICGIIACCFKLFLKIINRS